jgi:predicted RNase H-like nuclease (RuvC/YqgF family)
MATDPTGPVAFERAFGQVEGLLRALQGTVTDVKTAVERQEDKASDFRQVIYNELKDLSRKVDPLCKDVETLKLEVKNHTAKIDHLEVDHNERAGRVKMGRWFFHLLSAGIAAVVSALIAWLHK